MKRTTTTDAPRRKRGAKKPALRTFKQWAVVLQFRGIEIIAGVEEYKSDAESFAEGIKHFDYDYGGNYMEVPVKAVVRSVTVTMALKGGAA